MKLKLYATSDRENVINKTLNAQGETVINLKRSTDIIAPEITLVEIAGVDFHACNYAEIPELNRKYFIRSVESVNADLVRLSLETDYLETYKADILNSDANYRTRIGAGDYGTLTLETTGRQTVESFESDAELVESDNSVLSILGA